MSSEKGDTREMQIKTRMNEKRKYLTVFQIRTMVKIMIFLGTLTLPFLINKSR
ncbi:MAG: hypothetical protein WCC17_11300 [Candidatus Nitrosopolaris sp.]